MPARIYRHITRWIISHLLWDTSGSAREGSGAWLWPASRLFAAVAGAALLTWREWVEHHPPEIAIVTLIHFVFVLVAIALIVHIGRWFSRSNKRSAGRQPKGP
jgi:hypothetical protein